MRDFEMLTHLRLFFLYLHVLLTAALYWTKTDPIRVSTSSSSLEEVSKQLNSMIAFGLLSLFAKAMFYAQSYERVSIGLCLHLLCDVLGAFFMLWLLLDGWAWQSYAVIVVLFW